MQKIFYATGNLGKMEIVKSFFKDFSDFEIEQADIELVEEQDMSLESISLSKAKQAWDILKQPVLVDDSGCYFEKYNQFPGVMTKFVYQGLGFEGLYRLYDEGDIAEFVTKVAFANQDGIKIFEGKVRGTLIKDPSLIGKDSNLPFAHIMIPEGQTKTWYKLLKEDGSVEFAPRGIALKKFLDFLDV